MQSKAKTVSQYLAELPEDRREAVSAVREIILKNLPKGYAEGMGYGMISYHVPHSIYPAGYHCNPDQPLPFAALASQKNHVALYLMCLYSDPGLETWFRDAWAKTGKRLDMGKSCIRFRKLEDVPLKVIGQAIRKVPVKTFIEFYEDATRRPPAGKKIAGRGKASARGKPASGGNAVRRKTAGGSGKRAGARRATSRRPGRG